MEKPFLSGNIKLDEVSLRKIFLHNLNQIYPILLRLAESLPKLAKETHYGDLQNVVEELLSEINIQISRINNVYIQLKEVPVLQNNSNLNDILKTLIPDYDYEPYDNLLKDLSFIFYLQKIIAIKKNYYYILMSIAIPLNNINIKQHLQYCCDDCEDNQTVLGLIAKEYMQSTINNFLM